MSDRKLMIELKNFRQANVGLPLLVIFILGMMILPLPPILLDAFFSFNIALSLIVLLAVMYTNKPLHFSVFPTVLLLATLLRLALNVASTRVVLLHGQDGPGAAGHVIQSFGEVVIGGNYTVGFVVFAIIVIINFVVVTKGAGRVSEVSARFTLDALPGKQMAIDADLNAGLIDQEEARRRRQEVSEEADFYGSMDGSSKFVRGDAIAGLLILFINLIGGLLIGMSHHGMSVTEAAQVYALLTIGDGLVAQVPAILLSTAAAIMVTRVTSHQDMGNQLYSQLLNNPKSLAITGGILAILGLIPGMPHFAFLSLGLIAIGGSYLVYTRQILTGSSQMGYQGSHGQVAGHASHAGHMRHTPQVSAQGSMSEPHHPDAVPIRELDWNDVAQIDTIGLEIGYRLINLVDAEGGQGQDGQLMQRIKAVRKKLSSQLGFLIPSVHIRDNLDLAPNQYKITLMGVNYGEGEIHIDKLLAINPGHVFAELEGEHTKEPTFEMDAVWITEKQREFAQNNGYTIVDPSTVIATQISQIIQNHAADLLGHEEVQQLLDRLKESAPKLVETLTPGALPLSTIVVVLQKLLADKIPLIDMRSIAESLVYYASKTQDPDSLVEFIRVALRRLIMQQINGDKKNVEVATLDPSLEQILLQSAQVNAESGVVLEPGLAEKLVSALSHFITTIQAKSETAIMLVQPAIRSGLAKYLRYSLPDLQVLSYNEIPDEYQVQVTKVIGAA